MASAAGLPCDIDPALCAALRSQKSGFQLFYDSIRRHLFFGVIFQANLLLITTGQHSKNARATSRTRQRYEAIPYCGVLILPLLY